MNGSGTAGSGGAAPETVLEVPASAAQRRLWAVEQDAGGAPVHNIGVQVTSAGLLEPGALHAAAADLIERHEALRTSFRFIDGTLWQRVHAPGTRVAVEYADLTALPPPEAARRFHEVRQEAASAPFDLASPPLIRMVRVRRCWQAAAGRAVRDTLIVVVHHIVADARSSHIIVGDLQTAYLARKAGAAPAWPPVAVQYADFSAWLAGQADSPQAAEDLAYWREHLAGLGELDLTYGRPRSATPASYGGSLAVEFGTGMCDRIRELGRQERATAFMVLLAAYTAALGRVFGAADVPVGTSLSTRTDPGVQDTVGLFVDRAVLRVDLAGRPTFRDLVRRARLEVLAAHEHGMVGFDRIVTALAPPRRYGIEPLAQASINLQPVPPPSASAEGRPGPGGASGLAAPEKADDGQFGNGTVRHDLALDLSDDGACYHGWLDFRDGVVEAAAARRVIAVFGELLHAGTLDPDRPAAAVPAVSAAELRRLHASQDGGPTRAADGARSVLDLVDRWVRRTPDALAVDAPDARLTYRELAGQAAAVAAALRERGVTGAEPVLVALPRTAALPVAFLGVLAAGACYVPVDPDAPAARLAAIAGAMAARFALMLPGASPALPGGVACLPVQVTAAWPDPPPAPGACRPEAAAYALFTSGSTGPPKGVLVEHRNLAAYLGALLGLLSPPPGAVHLMVQAPTFDSSLGTLTAALASGGVLRLVSEEAARDPDLLAALLDGAPADYLKITPSHLSALLAGVPEPVLRPRRALVLGGEKAQHRLVRGLVRAGWMVYGHYGPTETTIGVLAGPLGEHTATPSQTVPLRRPLPGVAVYLLDEYGAPVPPGCRGELYVGGVLVSRGYLDMPGATAAAFVPDPFSGVPGARMYRTGDLVRRAGDGEFEFCGRVDRQVKIRGHRIEPGEIEAALAALPGVRQAAVVVAADPEPDDAGNDRLRLIGYAAPQPGHPLTPGRLLADLGGRLPAHLMPDTVLVLERLPMTRSGKLDVAALPRPPAGEASGPGHVSPDTPQEAVLAEVWQAVLGLERVSTTTRFFDAGGDSITAIEVVARSRARGLPLSVRELFEQQTIRRLAATAATRETEPLPVRAARAGLGAGTAPVIIRLEVPDPAAAIAELRGPGWARDGGVRVQWQGIEVTLTADPCRCDDRAVAALACFIAEAGQGPAAVQSGPGPAEGQDIADAGGPGQERAGQGGREGGPPAGAIRLRLSARAAAALREFPDADASVHDAYGTRPLDLAAAALLAALGEDGGGRSDEASRRILLADCTAEAAPPAGRPALPGVAWLDPPDAGGCPGPGELLQAAKSAVRAARDGAAEWAEAALACRTPVPGIVLRLLPLPDGAALVDPGTPGPAGRTVVLLAGAELLVIPPDGDGDRDAPDAAALAGRVRDRLESLAAHCAGREPVYRAADFPDAGLDDAALARLLGTLGGQR